MVHGKRGGDLLTIKSQLEARKITTELKKSKSDFDVHWTGLQDLNNDGIWTWFDGTEFDVNITKETRIVFQAIIVGSPRLCASFQTWSWILLPASISTQSMLPANYCPYQFSFICKRNSTTSVTQNPSVSSDWKDYLPSDYSWHLPTICPAGFIDLPKKCVRVEQNATTVLTWQQASSFCRDQYGNLSYLLSFHDDDEVMDLSVRLPSSERTEYWTGFWRYGTRKPCWSDNTKVNNISWSTFNQNEQQRSFFRKCGYLVHDSQSTRLHAIDCTLKKNFICQINKKATVSSSVNIVSEDFMNVTQCPPGFSFATTESCYKVVPEKMDFKRAELFCDKLNGSHLTSVESKFEDILLQRIAEYSSVTQFWLGLELQETPQLLDAGRLFYWNDGYPVLYDKWLKDQEINAVNKSESCVKHQGAEQWATSSCDETYPFICKIKLDQSDRLVNKRDGTFCPNQWLPFGSHCYYIERDIESTWREAAEECIHFNVNSTLTSITSDLEVQFVKYMVQGNVQSGVWTGVYLNRNNIPTSIDGTTVHLNGHEHSPEFPGKCGMLTPSDPSQNIQWTDCNQKHGYVWKIQKFEQKDFMTTNVTSAGCPSNEWVRLHNHCYLFLPDQFSTWAQANQLCSDKSEDLYANLVSIHSLKENHFIQMTLQDRTKLPFHRWSWIGCYEDRDSSDSEYLWQWTDKTSLDYHNWKTSSWSPPPKSDKQEGLCVAMDTVSGIWATKPCNDLYGVVCKIPFSKVLADSGIESTSGSLATLHTSQRVDIFSQDTTLEAITSIPQSNNFSAEDQTAENYTQNKERKRSFPVTSVIITVAISLLILILIFIITVILLRDRFSQ